MRRTKENLLSILIYVFDLCVVYGVIEFSFWFREHILWTLFNIPFDSSLSDKVFTYTFFIHGFALPAFAFFRWYIRKPFYREMIAISRGCIFSLFLFLSLSYLVKEFTYSRLLIMSSEVFILIALIRIFYYRKKRNWVFLAVFYIGWCILQGCLRLDTV